jgi:outer membrane protein assembly factor BamB
MHPGGPNGTPTIDGDRVFTVSADGQAFCFSADEGKEIWRANLVQAMGVKLPQWGFASSPVIHGGQVLFSAGKVAALDLASGKTVWVSAQDYLAGYSTVVVFPLNGQEFIAALDGKGLSILSAKDGREITRHPFKGMFDVVATTPFIFADGRRIFISSNLGSEMLGFDGQKLSSLWASTELKNAMNNSVPFDGVLYGIDGSPNLADSRLVSVNVEDGKLNWARAKFGYGTTIGVGRTLLALTETGEIVTVKPSVEGCQEISRQQILGKLCWTPPVYANQRVYARNDRGDVMCLSAPQ